MNSTATKKRKRKHGKGLSDSTLIKLWRQAVITTYGGKCVICQAIGNLECHHIVHCKIKVLRWDRDNGVPVCPSLRSNCHQFADSLAGREIVKQVIGQERYNHIKELEHVLFKDFIRNLGISENEWRKQVKQNLTDIIEHTS
jgi:hypothetical protein